MPERFCACKEFGKGMATLGSMILMASLHGQSYKGKPFRFCPWCGKMLEAAKARTSPGKTPRQR